MRRILALGLFVLIIGCGSDSEADRVLSDCLAAVVAAVSNHDHPVETNHQFGTRDISSQVDRFSSLPWERINVLESVTVDVGRSSTELDVPCAPFIERLN